MAINKSQRTPRRFLFRVRVRPHPFRGSRYVFARRFLRTLERVARARDMPNKLLHRSIDAVDGRLVLLAPPEAPIPASFENVEVNASRHAKLVTDIQRLRGRIYLQDGAVEPYQLTDEGLH